MQKVTGTYDIFGEYSNEFRTLEKFLFDMAELYNFDYIRTPIIENSSLYHRDNNNTIDNVNKNTYDFKDLAGKEITLRPEINSGIARAIMENHLYNNNLLKLFYYGDVFRYDKPQKDRYREFTQFGFEVIGGSKEIVDAEMLSLAYEIYHCLGVNDITLKINSLGNKDDINNYREILINYFSRYISEMCDDCKKRFVNNPLRILDCRDKHDQEIIQNAPKLIDNISKESRVKYENVLKYLRDKNIPFVIDDYFIRGIDYQNDTIFEIINNDKSLGSQNELCGGGRYDNLYNYLYGKNISAFGFDFGLERLISSIRSQNPSFFGTKKIDIYFVCLSEEDLAYCYRICDEFRKNGISVEYDLRNVSYKSQLKNADKYNPSYTAFIGENERNSGLINIRNNQDNSKQILSIEDIINVIKYDKERSMVKKYVSK